jgi:two-component system, response regulator / RNA-binding antiterminator
MDSGPISLLEVRSRLEAARLEFRAQARRYLELRAQLLLTMERARTGRSRREILHSSEYARLQARLESLPVIEQAKGIVMAEHQCGADEAFDLLRRASQRANIKLRVLAERIVEQAKTHPAGVAPPARHNDRAAG